MYHGLIDSLVLNANLNSISAMSWHHGSSGEICSFKRRKLSVELYIDLFLIITYK
jgi:hypothetical protein